MMKDNKEKKQAVKPKRVVDMNKSYESMASGEKE